MAAETVTPNAAATSPFFASSGGVSFLFHAAESKSVK
jgi:hypothetical protein